MKQTELKKLIPNVSLPEGKSGPWRVERFIVTELDAIKFNLSLDLDYVLQELGLPPRYISPDTYTRLTCNGKVVMSDTPAEKSEHVEFVRKAKGHILITGLGIGMVVNACLQKPEVLSVTVIEKSSRVIALSAAYYEETYGTRFRLIHADALDFIAPQMWCKGFSMAWHDIWPTICSSNLSQMDRIRDKYSFACREQSCWCEDECRAMARLITKARAHNRLKKQQLAAHGN